MKKKDKIFSAYMDYVLSKGKEPKSVYHFCKKAKIEEKTFYKHFSDLSCLKHGVYPRFHYHTMKVMSKSDDFDAMNPQDKLLTYYFTFFEILLANRSYVVHTLNSKNKLDSCKQLSGLRKEFIKFVDHIDVKNCKLPNEQIQKIHDKFIQETMWGQFVMLMQFWLSDKSKSMEKTDIFIEKTVAATFDIFEIEPMQSVMDWGKFLFKEKMGDKKMPKKFTCSKN